MCIELFTALGCFDDYCFFPYELGYFNWLEGFQKLEFATFDSDWMLFMIRPIAQIKILMRVK